MPTTALPGVIQGGMGVAVSGWRLARAVSSTGQLGVVSGTALGVVAARTLADGDPGGHLRRAADAFPLPDVADRVIRRWFVEGGRDPDQPYPAVPMFSAPTNQGLVELCVFGTFAEVWLAKEGHAGPVGINLLHKVRIPTLPTLFGAMLAGVDVVIMGAGIPSDIPPLLDDLARGGRVTHHIELEGGDGFEVELDPPMWWNMRRALHRPTFLAVVSSHTLATFLARSPTSRPDGFVVEGPTAGGHNAPPRGRLELDERGQPVYGPRDQPDLERLGALGLPFWLAGGYGRPGGLAAARALGAAGIQVGTMFALCEESGLAPHVRTALLGAARARTLEVHTDPLASPSGYPFKVVRLDGTVADSVVYAARRRVCDLGYLRTPFRRDDGSIGFRCPSEPVEAHVRKGGDPADTEGRMCLCNGLTATVGLGQVRPGGTEPPLVTIGDGVDEVVRWLAPEEGGWTAADAVRLLLGTSG